MFIVDCMQMPNANLGHLASPRTAQSKCSDSFILLITLALTFWNHLARVVDEFLICFLAIDYFVQSTLTSRGSITARLVSSLLGLYSLVFIHTNDNIFHCLVKSNPVELETSYTAILFFYVFTPRLHWTVNIKQQIEYT